MMSLTTAAFTAASVAVSVFSPSRNACIKRVAPSRFRYDPYSAPVLSKEHLMGAMAAPQPVTPMSAVKDCAKLAKAVLTPVTKIPAARYAVVHFKHESVTYLAHFRVAVGDIVVVEGDRGENIGTVSEITKESPMYEVHNKIVRRATEEDLCALSAQREREAIAVQTTRAMAESFALRATIEDAEYQFDGNKLTIFVRRASKNTFVDFRKLQRGLFREFRCRIWCAYMDEVEAAEAAPRCR